MRVVGNHGLGPIGELHEIKQFLRAALGCRAVETIHPADELQILSTRQTLEKSHAFGHNADLAFNFDGISGKIHAQKLDTAGSWREQAGQNLDGRRFSRSVRP